MAEIAKTGIPSLASQTPPANNKVTGLLAGEDIAAGDACRIDPVAGRVFRSSGAAAGANAKVRGYAQIAAKSGEAVSLYFGITMRYGAGLAPGADVFLSGTVPGGLADAASIGGTAPIGFVVDATRIHLGRSNY